MLDLILKVSLAIHYEATWRSRLYQRRNSKCDSVITWIPWEAGSELEFSVQAIYAGVLMAGLVVTEGSKRSKTSQREMSICDTDLRECHKDFRS